MTCEWDEKSLGYLAENFDALRRPVKEVDRKAGPYPYYGASGIVDHVDQYIFDGEYVLIAEDGENLRSRKTPVAFLSTDKFWVNNHAHIVRANQLADTRFLMYALACTDIGGYLTGSTMPKLTQGNMERILLPAPPLSQQKAIASILGALDDKIELNVKTSKTLEEMARATFKSWFVDFDPVRAKMQGRKPSGMDDATAALFPDSLKDSELGPIPEGWTAGTLGEIIAQRYERVGLGEAVVLSAVASGDLVRSEEHFTKRIYSDNIAKYLAVQQWDFAYNPSRINIGSIGMLKETVLGAVSPVYVVLRPRPSYRWFLEFVLKLPVTGEWISTLASGSVRQSLSYADFASIPCVVPPEGLTKAFDTLWLSFRAAVDASVAQTQILARIRDALLPKLISGALRLKGEMIVEETT